MYSGPIAGRAGCGVRLDFDMLKLGDVLKSLGVIDSNRGPGEGERARAS